MYLYSISEESIHSMSHDSTVAYVDSDLGAVCKSVDSIVAGLFAVTIMALCGVHGWNLRQGAAWRHFVARSPSPPRSLKGIVYITYIYTYTYILYIYACIYIYITTLGNSIFRI